MDFRLNKKELSEEYGQEPATVMTLDASTKKIP
jgi:hypothetical protein